MPTKKRRKVYRWEYFQICPSDRTPSRRYGTIKAHKPEKNELMRTTVSTIGVPAYGISKYLDEIIQPTLHKNNSKIRNSRLFGSKQTTGKSNQLKSKYLTML